MRQALLLSLLLLFPLIADAQPRPGSFTTLTATSTSASAVLVGCAIGSTTCTGGLKAGILATADGSASAPSHSWYGDTDTGFYRSASNIIAVTVGGVQAGTWTTTGTGIFVSTHANILARDISTTGGELHILAPAGKDGYLAFTEDGVANRWSIGTNDADPLLYFRPGLTTATPVLTLSSTTMTMATGYTMTLPVGTGSAPTLVAVDDADTGLYPATNTLNLGRNLNAVGTKAQIQFGTSGTPTVDFIMGDGASTALTSFRVGAVRVSLNAGAALNLWGLTFASLPGSPSNGDLYYCTDCLVGSVPCTAASTGAIATRVNGAWRCL